MSMHARPPKRTNRTSPFCGCISARSISGAESAVVMVVTSIRPSRRFTAHLSASAPPMSRPGTPLNPYTVIVISPA
jgi:hypothetical protein